MRPRSRRLPSAGWLNGWSVVHGSEVNPESAPSERADYSAVVLRATLREAVARLNPELPPEALNDAARRLNRPEGATVEARNRSFHRMVIDGVTVEYRDDGRVRGAQARVVDFDDASNNDWLAVDQFTVVENKIERRPDIVLFVNGLPLGVIELKNPTDPEATIWTCSPTATILTTSCSPPSPTALTCCASRRCRRKPESTYDSF